MKKKLTIIQEHFKLTKKDFAKKIGISATAYNNYINEGRIPATDVILKLNEVFHINPNWLLVNDSSEDMFMNNITTLTSEEHKEYAADKAPLVNIDIANDFNQLSSLQQEYYSLLIKADLVKNKMKEE